MPTKTTISQFTHCFRIHARMWCTPWICCTN